MRKQELGERLMAAAYLEGDFVLRSGRRSRYYLDKYLFETDPGILAGISEGLAELVQSRGTTYDRLAAPELGAVAIAAGLSLHIGLPFVIVRKEAKEYGTAGQHLEGGWEPGERVAVVEDVVTSGGAALQAVEKLRAAGLVVEELFCVVDREEGGREAAARAGVDLVSLFTASELGVGA